MKRLSIQCLGAFAVEARGAFEQCELIIALTLGSENPHRREDVPPRSLVETQVLGVTLQVRNFAGSGHQKGRGKGRIRLIFFEK